jgi:hypothetical protein
MKQAVIVLVDEDGFVGTWAVVAHDYGVSLVPIGGDRDQAPLVELNDQLYELLKGDGA